MCTFVNQNFVQGQPSKVLSMRRLPRMTRSTAEQHKCDKIDSMVSPQDILECEEVLVKAARHISTQDTIETMKPEKNNLVNNALSLCPKDLLPNTHDEKSLMPSVASATTAKCCLDEELRLNELQIILLQERINHRNRAKLANITNAAQHELVYCPNHSWKIITNVNQQSVLQRCQFPCIVSKAALWRFS